MKLFSYLFPGSLTLSSEKKIIPSAEFSKLLDAKEVLEKAQQEALKKQEETKLESEALRQKAQQEGFQKGLEEFNAHILSLDGAAKKIYLDMQKVVLSIALKAAQKIVKKELEMHPDTIVDIVTQELNQAKHNKRVTIFVDKSDKEALELNKPKLKELFENIQVLSIQERSDVSPGGCIIETETGIINAKIEKQWEALERAFALYKQ
jgi:type III secretion protein L